MRAVILVFLILCACKPAEYIQGNWDIKIRDDMPFVKLNVNNKKALFLLDTGAGMSLIDYSQAAKYGFRLGDASNTIAVTGIGGTNSIFTVRDIEVYYQDSRANIKLYGSDMRKLNEALGKQHIHILGILGSDFLAGNNAQIDFETMTLVLNGRE